MLSIIAAQIFSTLMNRSAINNGQNGHRHVSCCMASSDSDKVGGATDPRGIQPFTIL